MKFVQMIVSVVVLLVVSGAFAPVPAHSKDIRWQTFSNGMARSKSENKKVFVHFYADWCGTCKIMEKKTFKDPGVIAALNKNYIPVKVDVDREQKISEMFRVKLLPDSWFIAENNQIIGHRPGYIAPEQLKALLKMFMEDDF